MVFFMITNTAWVLDPDAWRGLGDATAFAEVVDEEVVVPICVRAVDVLQRLLLLGQELLVAHGSEFVSQGILLVAGEREFLFGDGHGIWWVEVVMSQGLLG